MNIIKKLTLFLSVFALASCAEKEEPIVYLDVNANNISGSWQLAEWNGSSLDASTYMYVNFVRNDRTFTIYQNLDSFTNVPHVLTGSYVLSTDVELGAIIRGIYDHDCGEWSHRYIIKSLTSNEMVWVATDDASFTQTFVRVDNIPVK